MTICGTPDFIATWVVPEPPWCMTAATLGKSFPCGSGPMKSTRSGARSRCSPAQPRETRARTPARRTASSRRSAVRRGLRSPMLPNPMNTGGDPDARKRSVSAETSLASGRKMAPVCTRRGMGRSGVARGASVGSVAMTVRSPSNAGQNSRIGASFQARRCRLMGERRSQRQIHSFTTHSSGFIQRGVSIFVTTGEGCSREGMSEGEKAKKT